MTKQEFLDNCRPFAEWKSKHDRLVKECFDQMSEWWDIDGFLKKYSGVKAEREVLETILYDAFEDHNHEPFERDDHISRLLCVPLEEVMEFEKWDGAKEGADDEK